MWPAFYISGDVFDLYDCFSCIIGGGDEKRKFNAFGRLIWPFFFPIFVQYLFTSLTSVFSF